MEGDAEVIIKTIIARDSMNPEYGRVIQDVRCKFSFLCFLSC